MEQYIKLTILIMIFASSVSAQNNYKHTNKNDTTINSIDDNKFRFKAKQLIAPGIFITIGALGINNSGWFHKKINLGTKDRLERWKGNKKFTYDDYFQYIPVVAHFGLSLCGVKAKTSYKERLAVIATSYIALGIMVNGTKYTVKKLRPDNTKRNSFVSGHTATAFMGAELVRSEYNDASPWYGIGAYTIATGIGFMRLYNNRHWVSDVIAGAGVGILSARIGYWLLPLEKKLFGWDKKKHFMTAIPYYLPDTKSVGASISLSF